ncbi:Exonuclease, RNase T/DNA polymerase III [uncultured Caudovirales phage]|uniref:Exonuclease, RNase T/DNA polymerase III n=1 Tax=uncultured Caudovirales phage TaxID=2100421 RepID=A0A6J5M827_9CAUD|nr:Exonuclease, RNase T/DNA polymerase III [uncultured Caudovirales phage]
MRSIFFDLETTDLNPIGQILNFAFVEYDEEWNVKSSYSDKIKISRMQLPSPEAILSNRVDVIQHNNEAVDLEHIAMAKIQKYIQGIVEWNETRLIGYNSHRFDVPFLRTSMIRNGLNPYFGGSLKYGDMFHAIKRLACDNQSFKDALIKKSDGSISYSLESVAKSFKLLDESDVQEHESLSDVKLTVKLAKYILDNYGIDVRTYCAYEPLLQSGGYDVIKVFPYRDENGNKVPDDYCYFALLQQNKTQALWINIRQFEDGLGKKSISWYNKNSSALFVSKFIKESGWNERADVARKNLSHITLDNFWPEKNCDVEQFIFMLPINEISALYDAIWRKDLFLIKETRSKYASQLYIRFLNNTLDIDQVESTILDYSMYRYGGKLKLDKDNYQDVYTPGVYNKSFHSTYKELLNKIENYSKESKNSFLMSQLKCYYESSIVAAIAGKHLMNIEDRK